MDKRTRGPSPRGNFEQSKTTAEEIRRCEEAERLAKNERLRALRLSLKLPVTDNSSSPDPSG